MKKKKDKIIKAYMKCVQNKPTDRRCLIILDLNPFRPYIKESVVWRERIPEFSSARKETVDIDIFITSKNGQKKSHNLSE